VGASFVGVASSAEYVRAGKLRALAVTTTTRSESLPNIPIVSEFVPGYQVLTPALQKMDKKALRPSSPLHCVGAAGWLDTNSLGVTQPEWYVDARSS
jgi:hypothetical protein